VAPPSLDRRSGPHPEPLDAFLARLPKVELHCHLDGSPRLATLVELTASSSGMGAKRAAAVLEAELSPGASRGSLAAYLAVFRHILAPLQTEAALERVAFELAEDAAAERVRWLEVRYCPVLNQQGGLSSQAVVTAVRAGLARAQQTHGIESGQLLCALRHHSTEESLALATLASANDSSVEWWRSAHSS
jgi:adenosine deaminase